MRHADRINLEINLKADGLLHSSSAVQGRTAGTTVGVGVADWSLRDRDRSGGRVGEGSEEDNDRCGGKLHVESIMIDFLLLEAAFCDDEVLLCIR